MEGEGGGGGIANTKMYTFFQQNVVAMLVCINEYGHRLTFEIFYYVKYYEKYSL